MNFFSVFSKVSSTTNRLLFAPGLLAGWKISKDSILKSGRRGGRSVREARRRRRVELLQTIVWVGWVSGHQRCETIEKIGISHFHDVPFFLFLGDTETERDHGGVGRQR
ncbi:hypothetical protein BJY04DRAFT_183362 [Aspergillus karnatakaensis]|uniref:uncharacterized protein n=1 Tax=Aspergillus karnatakaensis TaxID=1810916 RepID=UPI003CCCBF9B